MQHKSNATFSNDDSLGKLTFESTISGNKDSKMGTVKTGKPLRDSLPLRSFKKKSKIKLKKFGNSKEAQPKSTNDILKKMTRSKTKRNRSLDRVRKKKNFRGFKADKLAAGKTKTDKLKNMRIGKFKMRDGELPKTVKSTHLRKPKKSGKKKKIAKMQSLIKLGDETKTQIKELPMTITWLVGVGPNGLELMKSADVEDKPRARPRPREKGKKRKKKVDKMMSLQSITKPKKFPVKKKKKKKIDSKAKSSIKITLNRGKVKQSDMNRMKSQTMKPSKSKDLIKTTNRSLSQKNLKNNANLEVTPKRDPNQGRKSFTIGRMREVIRNGGDVNSVFKVSNIIKTVSSRSRRLKRMNRSVFVGGDKRRKFLKQFFELAHSSKAIGVGGENDRLPVPKVKPKKKSTDSETSKEEFDIYGTNSSAEARERSVENNFQVELENPETEHGAADRKDNRSMPMAIETQEKSAFEPAVFGEKLNQLRVRNSFVFNRDLIPLPEQSKPEVPLQSIQEYGKTRVPKAQVEGIFGLCHCPGKNHTKKKTKKKTLSKETCNQRKRRKKDCCV